MNWLSYSLLASLFFAVSSLIDKIFIDRVLKDISALTIVILSAISGLPFLFLMLVFTDKLPSLNTVFFGFTASWLILAGSHFYFSALRHAEAAVVMSIFQLILPFNYIFGVIFFDEKLALTQIIGALIVMGGSIAVSIEQEEETKSWRIRRNAVALMVLASFLFSLSDVTFKLGGHESEFLPLAIAEYAGSVFGGFIIYFLSSKVHKELNSIFKSSKIKILSITQANEAFYLSASFLFRYALLIGPIALVQSIVGTSPIFVLIIAWVLGFLLPRYRQPGDGAKGTVIKITAMLVSCLGIILMSL